LRAAWWIDRRFPKARPALVLVIELLENLGFTIAEMKVWVWGWLFGENPDLGGAPQTPNIERRMRRLSNSPAQGSISSFAALSLRVVLSWVKGRNCATTLVLLVKG
jgi:hypothetical protein